MVKFSFKIKFNVKNCNFLPCRIYHSNKLLNCITSQNLITNQNHFREIILFFFRRPDTPKNWIDAEFLVLLQCNVEYSNTVTQPTKNIEKFPNRNKKWKFWLFNCNISAKVFFWIEPSLFFSGLFNTRKKKKIEFVGQFEILPN